MSRDPLEFSASANFYEYAGNNPVDFSDPTGTQPAPGVPGGFGGMGGGGGGLGGLADYMAQGGSSSATEAVESDLPGGLPAQPLGVHGVGVGLVLGRQFSLGQSAGGDQVLPAQQTGGIEPVRLLAPFMRLPSTPGESPGEGWIQKGPRGNWFYPQTGQTLSPDLNHGGPKGPHFDLQRRGSGKLSLRMLEDELQFYLESGDVWLPIEALPMVP